MYWLLIVIIIVFIAVIRRNRKPADTIFEPPEKQAGRIGEKIASDIIRRVLREDDILLTNVNISYDSRPAELDNVVINSYGVFIIEVKNDIGYIVGEENDFEWQKYKTTDAGNTYEKTVKNPIKQVKRQIYILAHYLDYYGVKVWVSGYAILLHNNSPVKSSYILTNEADIDHAIHTPGRSRLSKATVSKIAELLK